MSGIVSNNHGSTAKNAADKISSTKADNQRFKILQAVADSYVGSRVNEDAGLTRDELSVILDMLPNSVRPRCNELINKYNYLKVASFTRKALQSDCEVEVLLLTDDGAKYLMENE